MAFAVLRENSSTKNVFCWFPMLRSVLKLKTFRNKTLALIGFFCGAWTLSSQSVWTKSWDMESLDHVALVLPYASAISLSNRLDNTLVISYQTDGELQDQMGLRSQSENRELLLTEFRNPIYPIRQTSSPLIKSLPVVSKSKPHPS